MTPLVAGCSMGSVVLSGIVAAAVAPLERAAESTSGLGVMVFGDKEGGTGYFDFALEGGGRPGGSLVFAAEHHDEYPDFVITLEKVERLTFSGKSFTLRGKGKLHDDPVTIRATGTDGNGTPKPDTFRIEALRGTNVLFEAAGAVVSGDIQVGTDE